MGKNVFCERYRECEQMLNYRASWNWTPDTVNTWKGIFYYVRNLLNSLFAQVIHNMLETYTIQLSFYFFLSFQPEKPTHKPYIATVNFTYQIHSLRFIFFFAKFPRQIFIFIYHTAHTQRFWCAEDVFRPPLHKMHILEQANLFKWRYTKSVINGV